MSNIKIILERLGNPQDSMRFVHVAGTNGKGSVCAMLAKIHEENGFKTGLFTSPHIKNYTERIKINFEDAFQNSLDYDFELGFDIREFITITFVLSGSNNNFLKYTHDSRHGKFDFGEFFRDILRGINVFSSDMSLSNFKMNALTIKVGHNMGDWDFSFAFTGKFEQNGNEYEWKPEYSINLHWAVIPELKIDKTIKSSSKQE